MNFLWFVGLVCFAAVSLRSQSDSMFLEPKRQESRRRFCGNHLADTLSLLCQGVYNDWSRISKKDGSWADISPEDYDQSPPQLEWPFISHQSAVSFMTGDAPHYQRYRRGVYDECCKNPCSLSELKTYCAPREI